MASPAAGGKRSRAALCPRPILLIWGRSWSRGGTACDSAAPCPALTSDHQPGRSGRVRWSGLVSEVPSG
eukprot:9107498-Alexandrium_andersonii.AAC.1